VVATSPSSPTYVDTARCIEEKVTTTHLHPTTSEITATVQPHTISHLHTLHDVLRNICPAYISIYFDR